MFEHLAGLLLTAERASVDGAVTVDMFRRSPEGLGGGSLTPMLESASPIGRIVAQAGRVCWVIAKGNGLTLSDVLAGETGMARDELEGVFQAAKTDGVPFGEWLVQSGLVESEQLRRALRDQAGSGLVSLANLRAQEDVAISIAAVPAVSYDATFTFTALELLQIGVGRSPELRRELGPLPATFARFAPKLQAAFCFRESESSELGLVPVSCWCRRELSLDAALELALAGVAATQPGDLLVSEIRPFVLITPGDDECWLCSWSPPHLCLFQVDTEQDYLRLVAALLEERRGDS